MVRYLLLLLAFIGSIGISTAGTLENTPQSGKWQLTDQTVAVVNGEPILLSDIRLYQLLFGERDFKRALDKLINIYLVAQYAQSQGLQIPPQKVSKIVEHFARSQGITVEQLYRELEKMGLGGAVFNNFIEKYNLYIGAIELFVLKPLRENKGQLELLIAAREPKAEPVYTLEILRIPKEVAEKNEELLLSMDIQKVAKELNLEPIKITTPLRALKPQIAQTVKRLSPGQTDFAEDRNYLYLVKVDKVEYKIPKGAREKIVKQIEEEKIEEFIKSLKENSVIKILPEALEALGISPQR